VSDWFRRKLAAAIEPAKKKSVLGDEVAWWYPTAGFDAL
jgi:hypothetical protein